MTKYSKEKSLELFLELTEFTLTDITMGPYRRSDEDPDIFWVRTTDDKLRLLNNNERTHECRQQEIGSNQSLLDCQRNNPNRNK